MSSESQTVGSAGDPPWWPTPFEPSLPSTIVTPIPGTVVIGPSIGPTIPLSGGSIPFEDPEAAENRLAIKAIKSILRSGGEISAEDKLRAIDALLQAILPEK